MAKRSARFMAWMVRRGWISEDRAIEWYPPFFLMRVKVLEIRDGWRHVRLRLPLNAFSVNPGGVMFGGYQAALADPVAALACSRVFPGYDVWTRAMTIEFEKGGSSDLELRFEFSPDQERAIREELEARGKITNVVAIRPKGYAGATAAPVGSEEI
jgi:acyl-coenzyme A thioesterase PaaI-like protein